MTISKRLGILDTSSLSGNAGEDAILEKAGIQEAVGLIAILGVDAENVFLILSARQMNPQI